MMMEEDKIVIFKFSFENMKSAMMMNGMNKQVIRSDVSKVKISERV